MSELVTCAGKVVALAPLVAIGPVWENGLYEDTHLAFPVHIQGLPQTLWFQSEDGTDAERAALRDAHAQLVAAWRLYHLKDGVSPGLFDLRHLLISLQAISAVSPLYTKRVAVGGWGGVGRHPPIYDIHVSGLSEPIRRSASVAVPLDVLTAERDALLEAWADWVDPLARQAV
ncbi:hypothetical protein [Asticcacaulis sp.]|uniref:hypothetical protein n=1 Tax=Asticcacaulis sp. TaxID=1872648 RepID=UPI00260AED22|nr:hypothetical protein [Asticcacaulis sp.]